MQSTRRFAWLGLLLNDMGRKFKVGTERDRCGEVEKESARKREIETERESETEVQGLVHKGGDAFSV